MKYLHVLIIVLGLISSGCNDKKRRIYPVDGFGVAGKIVYQQTTPTVSFLNTITKPSDFAPVSCAKIQVLNTTNNEIITESITNTEGEFSIELPADVIATPLRVRVLTISGLSNFPMMVVNQNENHRHAYSIDSEIFVGTKNDLEIRISDGLFRGTHSGAFNIYTQIMRGYKFMVEFGGERNTKFPELEVRWEDGEVGIDCTCFFKLFLRPATINLRQDEDDEAVILHEFAHYLHRSFSNDSSPGGQHFLSCDQRDDPRLTWSEGWATGFSLIVRKNTYYIDTGNQNFFIEHEFPCHVGQGLVSETVVAAVYLDLYDGGSNMASTDSEMITISFLDIWRAMKNVRGGSRLTFYDFYISLINLGAVSPQLWNLSFAHLGLDEATMQSQ